LSETGRTAAQHIFADNLAAERKAAFSEALRILEQEAAEGRQCGMEWHSIFDLVRDKFRTLAERPTEISRQLAQKDAQNAKAHLLRQLKDAHALTGKLLLSLHRKTKALKTEAEGWRDMVINAREQRDKADLKVEELQKRIVQLKTLLTEAQAKLLEYRDSLRARHSKTAVDVVLVPLLHDIEAALQTKEGDDGQER